MNQNRCKDCERILFSDFSCMCEISLKVITECIDKNIGSC